MTASFKTTEITDRIRNLIADGTFTFTPKIVQEGDLAFFVENPDPDLDVPAIFIKARGVGIEVDTLTGARTNTATEFRVLMVNSWTSAQEVVDKRTSELQQIAQIFIGTVGEGYDLGNPISGYTIIRAVPTRLEFEPPESALLSFLGERQLYATALTLTVTGFAERPT